MAWIEEREDTDKILGREIQPTDNGYLSEIHDRKVSEQKNELPDFDRPIFKFLKQGRDQ